MAELARVDEEDFIAAVAQLFVAGNAVRAVAGEEPEADGNLRRIEELARQRHHAIDHAGLALDAVAAAI